MVQFDSEFHSDFQEFQLDAEALAIFEKITKIVERMQSLVEDCLDDYPLDLGSKSLATDHKEKELMPLIFEVRTLLIQALAPQLPGRKLGVLRVRLTKHPKEQVGNSTPMPVWENGM